MSYPSTLRPALISALTVALVSAGLSPIGHAQSSGLTSIDAVSPSVSADQAGFEAVQALFFGVGPELKTLTNSRLWSDILAAQEPYDKELFADIAENTALELRAEDARVFSDFNKEIRSGDVFRVQAATKDMFETLYAVIAPEQSAPAPGGVQPAQFLNVAVGAFAILAVTLFAAGNFVMGVNVVAGANLAVGQNWGPAANAGATDIDTEAAMAELTQAFAGADASAPHNSFFGS